MKRTTTTQRPRAATAQGDLPVVSDYRREHAAEVLLRLRRVEGQIRGLMQMIESGRPCEEIAQQMSAARRAMDKVFFQMMSCTLMECMDGQDKSREDFERVVAILAKYA